MDTEKLINRGAIAVPFIHVITCGLFIAGYSAGFGAGIGSMFSASDFFTITIQHLSTVYITGLAVPIAGLYFLDRPGASDASGAEDTLPSKSPSRLLTKTATITIKIAEIFIPLLSAIFLAVLLLQISTDSVRIYHVGFMVIWMGTLPIWWRSAPKSKICGVPIQMVWVISTFVVGVLGMSMEAGDRDRRFPYTKLKSGRMSCEKHIILSPIGERFITVTRDNKRHIVNDECKVFAELEAVPVATERSLRDMVARTFFDAGSKKPLGRPEGAQSGKTGVSKSD